MQQMSLAAPMVVKKDRKTRQQVFLEEMERIVPWQILQDEITPHYCKPGALGGRPPVPLRIMLRIHFLQQWFSLSHEFDSSSPKFGFSEITPRNHAGFERI